MRKIILPFIVVAAAALMVSTTACKKAELDYSWYSMEGSGFYHSQDNSSSIKLLGFVQIGTPRVATEVIYAQIAAWEYVILEGNQVVLDINSSNYYQVLGDLFINQSFQQSDYLWVALQTLTPKSGDIFNGANPDTVDITFWIVDDNGNQSVMNTTVNFEFTRD